MNNLLGISKTLRNKWYIISAVILILAIAIVLIKSGDLSGLKANGAMVTITMADANYDRNKLTESVNKVEPKATVNYIENSATVNIVTTTKEKADEIFNTVKADFSLENEKPDVSGDILFNAINFNQSTVFLIIGVCFIFSFIIFCIVMDYKYAISNLASTIMSIITVLALFLALNLSLDMSFISMLVLTIILVFYFDMTNSIILKDEIKKVKKVVMSDIVDHLYENTIESNIIVKVVILCSLVVLAIVIPQLGIYALSTFIVILLSLYFSYFLTNPLWLKLKEGKKASGNLK